MNTLRTTTEPFGMLDTPSVPRLTLLNKLVPSAVSSIAASFQASEQFHPTRAMPSGDMTFAQWTERISDQSEFVAARELSGLSDDKLSALSYEFERAPRRQRTDVTRHGYRVAVIALVLAGLAAGLDYATATESTSLKGITPAGLLTAFFLLMVVGGVGAGTIGELRVQPLEAAHARLGLQVEVLDDQHPWLYMAHLLVSNQAANEYRERTLLERGPLRGADYLMMREIAEAHERLQLTQTASSIASRLQSVDASEQRDSRRPEPSPVEASASAGPVRGKEPASARKAPARAV